MFFHDLLKLLQIVQRPPRFSQNVNSSQRPQREDGEHEPKVLYSKRVIACEQRE